MELYAIAIEEQGIPVLGSYAPKETQQDFLKEIQQLFNLEVKNELTEEHKTLLKKLKRAKIIELHIKDYEVETKELTTLMEAYND